MDRRAVQACAEVLRAQGHAHAAAVVELARELGLRVREASLLNARAALRKAVHHGAVSITQGTKGGRGRRVDRWVPVLATPLESLRRGSSMSNPANQARAARQARATLPGAWRGSVAGHLAQLEGIASRIWRRWQVRPYLHELCSS